MTNAQIIFNASMALLEAGTIKGTGRFFTYEDEDGNKKQIEEPETLHTFAVWKKLGRVVKKGEKCKARIMIWKQGKDRTVTDEETGEEETKTGRMFMKTAFFFTIDQTEPINEAV